MARERERDRESKERITRRERIERKKRETRKIFLLVASLVVIAGIAFGVSYFIIGQSMEKTSGTIVADVTNNESTSNVVEAEPIGSTPEPTQSPLKTGIPEASEARSNNLLDVIMDGKGSHIAYLTFDDGPNDKITPQVLDVLAKYNVKATFFEVGKYIQEYPEMAKRVASEGHLIASHSYTHDYDALYATESSFKNEMEKTDKIISDIYGGEPPIHLMRFPGGSYNAGDHAAEKQIYKNTLKDLNMYYADWNCLNGDAEGKTKDANGLYDYFVSTIATNNIVVLMHDAATKQQTVNALPRIIEYLQANGWEFRTLADIPYNPSATIAPSALEGAAAAASTATPAPSSTSNKTTN